MKVAAVLLAAGLSTRFGADDKIAVPLHGLPLGLHATRTLEELDLAARIVITGAARLPWAGFVAIGNDDPAAGMSRSIHLGVTAARAMNVDAVLIALADMPFVPKVHFQRLLASWRGSDTITASSDGGRAMPPALFGRAWFDRLERLEGDRGARALLDRAERIITSAEALRDIDLPSDLPL